MRRLSLAVLLILAGGAGALAADDAGLPAGAGRAVMVRVCSQCHSPDAVLRENRDAKGWTDLVAQMKENGAEASDAEFAQIASYLAHAFPKK